jgi:hypothetical protein
VRLLYHCGGLIDNFPAFYRGWDFFRGFLTYPGGIVEYFSDFLVQSFYYSWLGAAVVTGQAWVICLCTDYAIRSFGISGWRGLRFGGPLLLLAIYSQYAFHFPTTMGVLVAPVSFCLYLRFSPNGTAGIILFFLILSTVLYITAGGPVLLFVVLCGLYEMLLRGRQVLGLAQLTSGAAMPYLLGIIVCGARFHDAYFQLLPFSWRLLSRQSGRTMLSAVYALYLFLPLVAVVLGSWRLFFRKRYRLVSSKARSGNPAKRSRGPGAIRGTVNKALRDGRGDAFSLSLRTLALVGITAVTLLLCRDPELRRTLRVDYFSRHRMWTEVIEIGRRSPYHYFVCHAVNRALYQTGRLGDEMFCFPQHPASLFLTRKGKPTWQKSDTCMDLGLINQAENALSISVETFGERPLLLQRLAVVNMVKGNVGAARVFLGALEKVPFWSSVARGYMAQLESDPDLSEDSEIQPLRNVMLHTDYVGEADTLTLLLTENPGNRMAYMYGMAGLLLSKNLDSFVQKLNTYHHRNFSTIPRHFQEALLLSRFLKKQPADVPGQMMITEQVKMQFSAFSRAMQQHGKNVPAARAALRERFGNTYFYYYFLGD